MSEKKKLSPIEIYRNSMTPEEYEQYKLKAAEGRRRAAEMRRKQKEEILAKAQALVPNLLAEEIKNQITGRDFKPSIEVTEKLRALVDQGVTLKEMRSKYFREIDQSVWDKIVKYIFRDQVVNAEDLAIRLLQSQQTYLKALRKQLKGVAKEKRICKKEKRQVSPNLMRLELSLSERIFQLESDISTAMLNLGVVGDKQKAGIVNIHMNIPRPVKQEKEVEAVEV
jgi:hypothetical protein